jgi:signal transduction histidine kinase
MRIGSLLFSIFLGGVTAAPEERPVREVQAAATAEGFHGADVEVKGVVTWADEAAGSYFFLQDGSGGIQLNYEQGPGPKVGDLLRAHGRLSQGTFAPLIEKATFLRLGQGQLPNSKFASGGGLLNGSFNCEWIETDGWIRTAEIVDTDTLVAVLDSGASRISFRVSHVNGIDPLSIIAAKARVRGVASPIRSRGTSGQLVEVQVLVSRMEDMFLGQRETKSPWDQSPTPFRSAFKYHPGQTRGDRLQVRGKVVHVADGIAWLHDGDAGLAIRGKDIGTLKRGHQVLAVGFRDLENFLPVLSDVVLQPDSGPEIALQPKEYPAWQLQDGFHHADHVAVSGRLLDRIEIPAGKEGRHLVLALQSPRGVFTAELGSASSLPELEPGSLLRVAGICVVRTDSAGDPMGFKMELPDAASITVLERAPFFTVRRMLILLSLMLGILLAAVLAGFFLARRNASLRAEVRERQAVASERGRLARDLHDTLEQGLTGIQLQIHGIGLSLKEAPPQTRDRLAAMRRMVQQCHTEVRQSIWDLRVEALDHFDLGEALQRMAQSLFLGSGIRVNFKQQREVGKIPGLISDNLLRIGQESMTNVLKHSHASIIEIELVATGQAVSLNVSDNGCGLADRGANEGSGGHFGLVGIDERAKRIGGKLSIGDRPGGGTVVRIEVPLP